MRSNLWRAALVVVLAGCSNELSGPTPSLPASSSPLSPTFVCNEQIESWVTVSGEDFSPLVNDALNDPSAENPTLVLTRSASIEGGTAESFSVTLSNTEETRVRWFSNQEMRFLVDPALGPCPVSTTSR